METDIGEGLHEKNGDNTRSESAQLNSPEGHVKDMSQISQAMEKVEVQKEGSKGLETSSHPSGFTPAHSTGEVNMEASITADDVVRAGGFGARDDIGSFLPVAIDSTDFEASLRDARGYEDPQGQTSRPGLGWTEAMESEKH